MHDCLSGQRPPELLPPLPPRREREIWGHPQGPRQGLQPLHSPWAQAGSSVEPGMHDCLGEQPRATSPRSAKREVAEPLPSQRNWGTRPLGGGPPHPQPPSRDGCRQSQNTASPRQPPAPPPGKLDPRPRLLASGGPGPRGRLRPGTAWPGGRAWSGMPDCLERTASTSYSPPREREREGWGTPPAPAVKGCLALPSATRGSATEHDCLASHASAPKRAPPPPTTERRRVWGDTPQAPVKGFALCTPLRAQGAGRA